MKGFNLTPSNASLRAAACEFSSLKRSAKVSLRKASFNFKTAHLSPRRSHDGLTSSPKSPAPPAPVRASADIPHNDEVICISRESTFDSSSVVDISPDVDELATPCGSPYASSCSSASSYSCDLPPEIDDRSLGAYDPRRGSQLSVVSSWVDDHLQELNISYREGGVYGIGIVTSEDGFHSRRDSFILPPYETFQSYHQKRNLPVVPPKYSPTLSRPLPIAPPPSPGSGPQSRQIRPLPPPPSR